MELSAPTPRDLFENQQQGFFSNPGLAPGDQEGLSPPFWNPSAPTPRDLFEPLSKVRQQTLALPLLHPPPRPDFVQEGSALEEEAQLLRRVQGDLGVVFSIILEQVVASEWTVAGGGGGGDCGPLGPSRPEGRYSNPPMLRGALWGSQDPALTPGAKC